MARSRGWCFTLNNYSDEEETAAQALPCQYLIYGRENAPTTGTRHLQGYVYFANGKTMSAVSRLLPRASLRAARGDAQQNFEYCSKDGSFFEKGVRPLSQTEKGDKEKCRWREALEAVREERLDDIDAEILCKHLRSLEYAVQRTELCKRKAEVIDGDMPHLWVYGKAGCGKTTYARFHTPHYLKNPKTEWWCGYKGERYVILEDVGLSAAGMADYFRNWIDRYPFAANMKQGGGTIRPPVVIVTSQYRPEQIWAGNQEMIDAMARRVTVVDLDAPEVEIPEPGPEWSENWCA